MSPHRQFNPVAQMCFSHAGTPIQLHFTAVLGWDEPMGSSRLSESSPFLCSCQKALHLLLKHSADVNARDKYWQTPLHVAAANRATKCVEAIIPLLSTVNVADRTGRTALHHAVHSGHLEVGDGAEGARASLRPLLRLSCSSWHWRGWNSSHGPHAAFLHPDGEPAVKQRGQPEYLR